jgi:hypothetical protein
LGCSAVVAQLSGEEAVQVRKPSSLQFYFVLKNGAGVNLNPMAFRPAMGCLPIRGHDGPGFKPAQDMGTRQHWRRHWATS